MALIDTLNDQYSEYQNNDAVKRFYNKNITEIYTLLKRTIEFELNPKKYGGLKETVLNYMENAFDEHIGSVASIKLLASDLEVLMKKVIEILEGNLDNVNSANDGNIYLKELSSHLNLSDCNCFKNVTIYIRNEQTHNSPKLPYHEYYQDLKDIILSYFLVVSCQYQKLYNKVFSEHIFTEYLKSVIEDYNTQQAVFVDLEVKEYIEIFGKEVQAKNAQQKARQDTILNLTKTIPEKQMMLLGQAGMGKTTSLLFLAKEDAQKILNNNKNVLLPVYITLASFTNSNDTILKKIAKRLERNEELIENYLNEGKITLFLDGFNEILEQFQHQIIRIIQGFIDDFPNTKIIIASRPVAYEEIDFKKSGKTPSQHRDVIPAFLLLELKDNLIKDFIKKNYKGDTEALFKEINSKPNLMSVLNNPLYLAEFISIYQDGNQMPSSTTVITERFINKKYKREKELIDTTFNQKEFANVMGEYTQHISVDDDFGMSNPQVPYKKVKEILEKIIQEKKYNINSDNFLKNAISLNLLVKNKQENTYYFAHQSYQDFFVDYEEE